MSNSVDGSHKKKSHDYHRPKSHDSEPKKPDSKAKVNGSKVSKGASSAMKSAASSVHKSSFEPAKPKGGASITYHKATLAPAPQKPTAPVQKEVGFPTTTGGASVTTQAAPPAPQGTTQYVLNGLSTIADSFVKDPGNTLKVIGDGMGGFGDANAWGQGLNNSGQFLADTGKGFFNHMIMEPAQGLADTLRPVVDGAGNTMAGLQTIGNALVTDPGTTLKVIGEGLGGFGDTNAWNAGIQQSSDFVNGLDEAAVNLVTSTVTGTVQQFQNLATAGSNIWNNGASTENIAALGDSVAAAGTTIINGAAMVDGAVSLAKGGTKLAGASAEGKAVTAEAKVAEAAQGAKAAETAQAAKAAETAQAAQAAIQAEAKSVLQRLQSNLNTLQERAAKYGMNQPVSLVNQIDDHQRAISMTESVLKGEASLGEMYSEMKSMLVDVKLPPAAPLSAANPRQALLTLTENQNALLEKAAKYGMDVPIELTNDIQRGKQTIEQALKAVKGELTPEEFAAALKPGPATPKEVLLGWVKDQNTLLEQAAKYGGQEPLHLINQIKDYGEAIDMARAVVEGQGTMSQLKEAVRSMIIDARVLNR